MNEEDLLSRSYSESGGQLRASLLAHTSRQIAWKPWARRAWLLSGAVACGWAGFLAAGLLHSGRPVQVVEVVRTVEVVREVPVIGPVPSPEPPAPQTAELTASSVVGEPELTAAEWELKAEMADGLQSAQYFCKAGNLFAGRGDWEAALRCFRNALDLAPDWVRDLRPAEEHWLLTSLKLSLAPESANETVYP